MNNFIDVKLFDKSVKAYRLALLKWNPFSKAGAPVHSLTTVENGFVMLRNKDGLLAKYGVTYSSGISWPTKFDINNDVD